MKLRKYFLPRNIRDWVSFIFLLVMIPIGYWFFVFVVLPTIYPVMSFWYLSHVIISTFFLINITSNFVCMVMQDCSISGEVMPSTKLSPDWKFCDICETVAPPRSFHCNECGICILKRDHHCQFSACCIGHQNQRFFLSFLLHLSIATIYSMYFQTIFFVQNSSFTIFTFVRFVFPLAVLVMGYDVTLEHVYTILYVLNILCMLTATILFMYHLNGALKGASMYEKNHNIHDYDAGSLKENIIQVAGDRWYLTWIFPFIDSKLPHDGINWIKCNVKND